MEEEISPSKQNTKRLLRIVKDIVEFDITAADALAKFQTLQRRAEDAIADRAMPVGNHYNLEQARRKSAVKRKVDAEKFAQAINKAIDFVMSNGAKTNREIADKLNEMGVRPWRSDKWTPLAVFRMRTRQTRKK